MATGEDLKYPIGREEDQDAYSAPFGGELKLQLIADIKMLPANLEFAIQNLDAMQLATPYRECGWTVQQLVHHVADSHINAYTRFKLGLTEDSPVIKPYDQEAWAKLPDTEKLPVNMSLTLLHALHARWCCFMAEMNENEWQRTVYHPEKKVTITLWQLLKSYSWHGRHHTAHIHSLRRSMNWN